MVKFDSCLVAEMLCLKAEVLDDHDDLRPQNQSSRSENNNATGFVLPISFGSSISRYLWKANKSSNRSISLGDGFPSSSDLEDKENGQEKGGNMCLYKCQLEQDVERLKKQLQEEIGLRSALASAVEHSDSLLSNSPGQLPDKAQELLDSIAVLEITISKLEQESVALQYQLSQERNERRLAEYSLRHVPSPTSSPFDSSLPLFTEPIVRPCNEEKDQGELDGVLPWPDMIEEPTKNYFVENLWHHPNQLSEEMILCMRDIFLFLEDSSKHSSSECMASSSSPQGHLSSSSLASLSDSPIMTSSVKSPSTDMEHGSEVFAREGKFDPYGVPGKMDWAGSIGTYSMAVEVSWLSVGKRELEYAAGALKRLLVEQLAKVNPSCLSCSEKLAFWINLYNALIMHAYLAYGVPKSEIKLFSLMQKAAYTVGGHSFTAADIEYVILKLKPPAYHPQIALVLALQKLKVTEEQKEYSIDHPEPRLAFALSCGMHSSPAVRIFRPNNVNELLKKSLKDYIQASVGITNKGKILVPKLLHGFAKGVVEESQLPEWICQFLSPEQAAMVRDCSSNQKWRLLGARSFSILPFDSRFRFLFLMEDGNLDSSA